MTWFAILLSLAGFGGPTMEVKPRKCVATTSIGAAAYTPAAKKTCKQKPVKAKPKPKKPGNPGAETPSTNPSPRPDSPSSGDKPEATPTPKPGATATPTPTATPVATTTPVPLPSRTNVDLTDVREWTVRPSYRILAAGKIDFNANNRGEDDHNLTVRDATRDLGKIDLAPGETKTLTVTLPAGSYTLYCSLPQHEEAGMAAAISVR
ncbi:plastocyanin/azurin family copper-binding protein [Solirubrobacter phytolaccae]|uniref:Plastocyanin/azurin family copper-binding protein n=1 Tax=Solirubrobacter phytolaccae TaxID=1404360 RepID=A0A9X3N596_9ACTN|nr:plastocyanin/azurin family copper-binding protein [Solirubrobacter phytolaccae]MDA0180145.1 plastocyanin/azurin family copper-binding protein [Solirubrobacter phytolaccae]